jgi:membrane-associated phospholipid phosphatase
MRVTLARWISIIGHPFIVVPLTVALVSKSLVMTVVLIAVMLVMIFGILRKVRRGDWTNFDVSLREHRPGMYARAIPVLAAAWLLLLLLGQPPAVLWGFGASIAIMAIATLLNRLRLKVSMHSAFTTYAAVLPAVVMQPLAVGLACLAILVAWSRVVLGRHTVAEVIVGSVLGGLAGAALHLLG